MNKLSIVLVLIFVFGMGYFSRDFFMKEGVSSKDKEASLVQIDLNSAQKTYKSLKESGSKEINMLAILKPQKEKIELTNNLVANAAPNIGGFVYVTCFSIGPTGSWSGLGSGWINAGRRGDYFNAFGGAYFNWSGEEDIVCFDWGETGEI